MRKRYSINQATRQRHPWQAISSDARHHLYLALAVIFLPLFAMQITANPSAAASSYDPVSFEHPFSIYSDPSCPTGTYTVPYSTRFVEIVAVGGAGSDGLSTQSLDFQYGGKGGRGAKVTAVIPVTPGQSLSAIVARPGGVSYEHDHSGWPNGGISEVPYSQGGGSTFVSTQTFSTAASCKSGIDRNQILLLAGGGGGGGAAGSFGSGGNGGNAGGADWNGELGAAAYHLDSDCDYGRGASGGSQSGPGYYGAGGCQSIGNGQVGNGFFGGNSSWFTGGGSFGGAGGGGWYGGGSGGPSGGSLGAGGGGAGSSYIRPTNYPVSISQDTSGKPIITITPLAVPATNAILTGTTTDNSWYTSTLTVSLAAQAGTYTLGKTYYALDDPGCSAANVHALARCTEYTGPFTISSGAHTLTYFSIDAKGLDEAVHTRSFVVTPLTSSGVTATKIGTGTNPTATAGGAAGANGSISVSGTGSGVVGAAVYSANPVGAPIFKSSGAYVDVIASSGLTALTFKDCKLDGGTNVYWWNGTTWALVSNQTYDPATQCVTVRVDSTTVPTVSQLTGTVIAAGSPPSITAVAKTADGKPYSAGVWTNQTVTVAFICTANATPTAPIVRASEGQNQSASGTCTDGLGQQATTTFTGINIDQTPPACTIQVSPSVIWPPNGKPVAITGAVTASDNRAGIARVAGGAVTSNEGLNSGDVQGFIVNTSYPSPLKLSAVMPLNGTLVAQRAGGGNGRTYSQLVTVTDHAGNTASCTWTVIVPHDQR